MVVSFLADYPDSIEIIARWYYEEWAQHYDVLFSEVLKDVRSKSVSKTEIPLTIVGTIAGKAVGAVELKLFENKDFDYEYWLGGLFVIPSKRHSGVAKTLISFAIDCAARCVVQKLYLQCKNEHQALYALFGFKPVHFIANNACIMVTSVKSA